MIIEARENGARLQLACEIVGISDRTYQRWLDGGGVKEDLRPYAERPEPANKLTKEEHDLVIKTTSLPEYADLPPSQIVPRLADKGEYIASESTMYRILKAENMQHHRSRSKAPSKSKAPDTHVANSDALFRTCKYRPNYPSECSVCIDKAREWVHKFVEWYNDEHYPSGLNFVTPNMRHNGTADKVMIKRKRLYKAAREAHPERWAKKTRNWDLPKTVALNPTKEEECDTNKSI